MLICLLQPLATEQSLGVPFPCLGKVPETFQWQIPHSLKPAEERALGIQQGQWRSKSMSREIRNGGSSNGGLRPLSQAHAQSSAIVRILAFCALSSKNFRRKNDDKCRQPRTIEDKYPKPPFESPH